MQRLSKFSKIGIVGGGVMGSGIAAQVAAVSKLPVNLYLKSDLHIQKSSTTISTWIRFLLSKSGPEAQKDAKSLISYQKSYDTIPECDLIIESISEDLNLKKAFFNSVYPLVSSSQIIASNTSSFLISNLASLTPFPQNFIGMHFFSL